MNHNFAKKLSSSKVPKFHKGGPLQTYKQSIFLQVFSMSSKWKVEKMMKEEKIYVSNNTNEAEECLADGDCTKLGQMLSNQGS